MQVAQLMTDANRTAVSEGGRGGGSVDTAQMMVEEALSMGVDFLGDWGGVQQSDEEAAR